MSHAEVATKIGQVLASKLQGISDEKVIKTLTIQAWKELKEKITNPSTFSSRGLSNVRKAVKQAFPDSEKPKSGYYHTNQGKEQITRYEHLSLWYLTSNADRWEIFGDKARQEYFENLPKLTVQTEQQPKQQPEQQPQQPKLTMTLETLNLTDDTKNLVSNALDHSGISLEEFIQNACSTYAKSLINKVKAIDSLETISTAELLNNSKYRTLPGRGEELAKRAIQAMISHNDMATEIDQKWFISQTSVSTLTGSKPTAVKPVIEQSKIKIDDHNIKHGLNAYTNRRQGRNLEDEINFINFDANNQSLPIASESVKQIKETIETVQETTETVQETTETQQPIEELKPVEPIKEPIKPVLNIARETFTMDAKTATTLEIYDYLKQNPKSRVRTKDGRKALHYVLAKNESGEIIGIMNEESGDIERITC
jgi:uncharacterized protein (DUF1778 family)